MLNIREEIPINKWPNECQIAVILVINSEVFMKGHGGPCVQPHLSHLTPDVANSGWRDYGNRQGTERLLKIFSDLEIPVSIALNSYLIQEEPAVFKNILSNYVNNKDQVDIIGHGLTNSLSAVKHLSFEEQLVQSLDQIQIALPDRKRPKAWLTPGFAISENSQEILVKHGIRMSLDVTDDDIIYKMRSSTDPNKQLIMLPYSMETNDISLCLSRGYTAEQYAQTLVDYVHQLSSENNSNAKVVCFGLHTFIAGTPAKALHFRRALEKIKKMKNVCFLNCSQLLPYIS